MAEKSAAKNLFVDFGAWLAGSKPQASLGPRKFPIIFRPTSPFLLWCVSVFFSDEMSFGAHALVQSMVYLGNERDILVCVDHVVPVYFPGVWMQHDATNLAVIWGACGLRTFRKLNSEAGASWWLPLRAWEAIHGLLAAWNSWRNFLFLARQGNVTFWTWMSELTDDWCSWPDKFMETSSAVDADSSCRFIGKMHRDKLAAMQILQLVFVQTHCAKVYVRNYQDMNYVLLWSHDWLIFLQASAAEALQNFFFWHFLHEKWFLFRFADWKSLPVYDVLPCAIYSAPALHRAWWPLAFNVQSRSGGAYWSETFGGWVAVWL